MKSNGRRRMQTVIEISKVNQPQGQQIIISKRNQITSSTILLCVIAIQLLALVGFCSASYYNRDPHGSNYDPEQQDGIPIFSARSLPRPAVHNDDDAWTSSEPVAANQLKPVLRRQSDADLDDSLEEEDEDEYKSGSSPHESIESPSYGESKRFARDGDEIEDFFDRHLGPQDEASASSPEESTARHDVVPAVDPDDHYEAAASSPLSSIFHSLLGHKHTSKLPFLQISTTVASDADSDSKAEADSKPASSKGLKASQSSQSYVEAAPMALAITPIAAPSSLLVQETSAYEQDPQASDQEQDEQQPPSSGIREIYIGRRPTVMSYLQQTYAAQQQQPYMQQQGVSTAGSPNVWRGPNGRPVVYEQEPANGYARHPLAAASYANQREQPTLSHASSAVDPTGVDNEQTVTYGLSLGSSGDSSMADDESPANEQEAANQTGEPAEQQPRGYVPYNTRYTTSSTKAHNNYYNNYYKQQPTGYVKAAYPMHPEQQQQMMMMMQQQHYQQGPAKQQQQLHYSNTGATRYHRDPSESANHLAAMRAAHYHGQVNAAGQVQVHRGLGNADQASGGNAEGDDEQSAQFEERQRLLASLDREIKASPQYRRANATAAASAQANAYARRPNQPLDHKQLVAFKAAKKTFLGKDLDTYNSFHSEQDPYKTYTKTSRMIVDPLALLANTRQPVQRGPLGEQYSQKSDINVQGASGQPAEPDKQSLTNGGNPVQTQDESSRQQVNQQHLQPQPHEPRNNLMTGLLMNYDSQRTNNPQAPLDPTKDKSEKIRLDSRNESEANNLSKPASRLDQGRSRVRREEPDERETDNDTDEDGVWVDDEEDDDNRQQSSDLNETAQDPGGEEEEEDDSQQDVAANNVPMAQQMNPPGVIGGPHGYELSPNDLMIYHG